MIIFYIVIGCFFFKWICIDSLFRKCSKDDYDYEKYCILKNKEKDDRKMKRKLENEELNKERFSKIIYLY